MAFPAVIDKDLVQIIIYSKIHTYLFLQIDSL